MPRPAHAHPPHPDRYTYALAAFLVATAALLLTITKAAGW